MGLAHDIWVQLRALRRLSPLKIIGLLQDMKQLVIHKAPLRSIYRSRLNNTQARTTIYRADFF